MSLRRHEGQAMRFGGLPANKAFFLLWLGQLVSLTGSSLTSFALGVWVYGRTGSATQYSLILIATTVPGICCAPFAGVLVDRWSRGRALMLSDTAGAVVALTTALLFFSERLEVWHLLVLLSLASAFRAVQMPAYLAATALLVDKEQLARAGGMTQMAQAVSLILGPGAGAALIALMGAGGVLLLDCLSFVFSLAVLATLPAPALFVPSGPGRARGSLLQEAMAGWRYIRERPGLLGLLVYFAVVNFSTAVMQVLATPMVLEFSSPATLGTVLSVGSLGMLAGGISMSVWGGPPRRIHTVLVCGGLAGFGLCAMGVRPSAPLIAVAFFVCMFCFPFVSASSQAIWQSKVTRALQGRVFATRTMIGWSSVPVGYLVAGPLADWIFKPLLTAGGPLVPTLGPILGVGPGRGIGLLFVLMGCVPVLASLLGYLYRPLRDVERDLPDSAPAAEEDASGASPEGKLHFVEAPRVS